MGKQADSGGGDGVDSSDANPDLVPYRTMGEWTFSSDAEYGSVFADVVVHAVFTGPSGETFRWPGFYDGDGIWKVRFNTGEVGRWSYRLTSVPEKADFEWQDEFTVTTGDTRGFLEATPGGGWGSAFESGEPVFVFGDTTYNQFGMGHCGIDVEAFLEQRARQGFNLLRARVPVSPFHPPQGYSAWQTRRTWT